MYLLLGGNLLCLETWRRDNGPHLQALHFAFGFGAFLAPLLATPFLPTGSDINGTNAVANLQDNETSTFTDVSPVKGVSPVKYAYLIISIFIAFVSFAFLMLCCCLRKSSNSSAVAESLKTEYAVRQERLNFRIQILILLFIFFFLYVGAEVTYGSLISKFAMLEFGLNKRDAAVLNSLFWGSFAGGRLVAIFLAQCLEPVHLLVADLVVSTASLAGLAAVKSIPEYLGNKVSSKTLLWVLTSTLGFGMASIFPSGLSWAERYIKVTGKAAAIFVVGSALGEMVLPALTGYIFFYRGAIWLMYVLLVASFASAVVFVSLMNITCSVGERYSKIPNQDEDMQLLKVADNDNLTSLPAEFPNGNDSTDRKKRVTFILNSESVHSSTREGNTKGSILRSKRVEKKD